jgi:hypothetical protein
MAGEDEPFQMELNLHPPPTSAAYSPKNVHSGSLRAEFVREFPSLPRVEGMSVTPEGPTYLRHGRGRRRASAPHSTPGGLTLAML